jgi:hypothetical protein
MGRNEEPAPPALAQFGRRCFPPACRAGRLGRSVPLRRPAGSRHGYRTSWRSRARPGARRPSAFYGIPAAAAAQRLQALGLCTQVRSVTVPGQPAGTVIGITPAGDVPPGTMITFYVATALPPGPGHPPHAAAPPRPPAVIAPGDDVDGLCLFPPRGGGG